MAATGFGLFNVVVCYANVLQNMVNAASAGVCTICGRPKRRQTYTGGILHRTVRLFCTKCNHTVRGKDWVDADKKFADHCERTGHYRLDLSCTACDYTARHSWPDVGPDAFDDHAKKTGHHTMRIVCPDCGLSMEGASFAELYEEYEEHGHDTAHDSYTFEPRSRRRFGIS